MAVKISSIGGFVVGKKEVLNPSFELENIASIHMTSDDLQTLL